MENNAYDAEIKRHASRNFLVNIGDISFVTLAGSFMYKATILPLYVSYLTSSAILIGLIPAIQAVAVYLPQLITARYAETLSRKKPFVVKVSLGERLPYLILTFSVLLWPGAPRWLAYTLLALVLATAQMSVGLGGPPWRAMLGKIILSHRKGLMYGLGIAAGGAMGIGGTLLSRHILAVRRFPESFGLCFLFAFAAQMISWLFLTLNHEPAKKPEGRTLQMSEYLRDLPKLLRENRSFARYLMSQVLMTFGGMGTGFFILYGREAFHFPDAYVASLTMVALISQAASTPFLGWLSDRFGHKWLGKTAAILGAGAAGIMLAAPNQLWMLPVMVLMNLSLSSVRISRPSIIMEFGRGQRLPTFMALSNTLLAVPTLAAPIIGGLIIETGGYRVLFVIATLFSLAAWGLLRYRVQDPRVVNGKDGE